MRAHRSVLLEIKRECLSLSSLLQQATVAAAEPFPVVYAQLREFLQQQGTRCVLNERTLACSAMITHVE